MKKCPIISELLFLDNVLEKMIGEAVNQQLDGQSEWGQASNMGLFDTIVC